MGPLVDFLMQIVSLYYEHAHKSGHRTLSCDDQSPFCDRVAHECIHH